MSSQLENLIAAEIRFNGPMPFSRFMELALYAPEFGYYTRSKASVGRQADFVTSPSGWPIFGRVLARLVSIAARALGDPLHLRIVDAGADDGRLLDALVERAVALCPRTALEAVVVERGHHRRHTAATLLARHPIDVIECADTSELAALDRRPGLVVANELFDALPMRRLRRGSAGGEEAHVDLLDGRLVEVWLASPTVVDWLPEGREGAVAAPEALVAQLASAIDEGLILIVDYGYPAAVLFAEDGPGNPIRGFRGGTIVDDVVADPGTTDLTAHVDFTAIDRAAKAVGLERIFFCDQTYLLLALGILDEVDAAQGKRLIHPEDMGGSFKALLLSKGLDRDEEPVKSALAQLSVRDRGRLLDGERSGS